MSRTAAGRPADDAEREAERRADRLAFELLAPAGLLAEEAAFSALVVRLEAAFGLPPAAAREYAEQLFPTPRIDPLFARVRKFGQSGVELPLNHRN